MPQSTSLSFYSQIRFIIFERPDLMFGIFASSRMISLELGFVCPCWHRSGYFFKQYNCNFLSRFKNIMCTQEHFLRFLSVYCEWKNAQILAVSICKQPNVTAVMKQSNQKVALSLYINYLTVRICHSVNVFIHISFPAWSALKNNEQMKGKESFVK